MVTEKCTGLALKDTRFNPSYCCSIIANLNTCNPPEAGTLTYSALATYALADRIKLVCVRVYVHVCACVRVFLYLPHIEYPNLHSTSNVRTFARSKDILAGPQNFKRLRLRTWF